MGTESRSSTSNPAKPTSGAAKKAGSGSGNGSVGKASSGSGPVTPTKGTPSMLKKLFAAAVSPSPTKPKPSITYQCVKMKDENGAEGSVDDDVFVCVFYWNGDKRSTEAINKILVSATEHNR